MVKVTIELVRKKAEHHNKELAPLKEIALHQEGIEKIECIQQWCPKLEILLLQSNLISKIENLNKLKELQYLNLAINNIEKVENLERCESLQKLDLTLNFIGELTSVASLKDNYNLQILFLQGNPCTDFKGYREYVITTLPQLESLDGEEIKRSERIKAFQHINLLMEDLLHQQNEYLEKRDEQKIRLTNDIQKRWENFDVNDSEENARFWNEKSEHAPETRIEIEKRNHLRKKTENDGSTVKEKKPRNFFAANGRPLNINEPKLDFHFNDENSDYFILELYLYKHLDTSLLTVDLQPWYVRIFIKAKVFQLALPEEIKTEQSFAKRSQMTGHLVLTLLKIHSDSNIEHINVVKTRKEGIENLQTESEENNKRRELLEIGPSRKIIDLTNTTRDKNDSKIISKKIFLSKEKIPGAEFEDDPDVPPLV